MPQMVGLENTAPVRTAYIVRSAAAAIRELKKKRVVSSADDYGAICAWRGRDGKYRVDAMRNLRTIEKETMTTLTHVRSWYAKWLKKIGEPGRGVS